MPRKARVEFAGAVYHLMDRGDRQEAIFLDDNDRERFIDTLGQACERTGWRVHAFVLMLLGFLIWISEVSLGFAVRQAQALSRSRRGIWDLRILRSSCKHEAIHRKGNAAGGNAITPAEAASQGFEP